MMSITEGNDPERAARLREYARSARNYQWKFMRRVDDLGGIWFTPWNKTRRAQLANEWRDGLLSGLDIAQWYTQHPDWFTVGEWSDEREARYITLTDAGRLALRNRTGDMEPYSGGLLVEPGWTAVPTEPVEEAI